MISTKVRSLITAASLGGLMALALTTPAHAAAKPKPAGTVDPLVSYFDLNQGDNEVRVINPTRASGDLCAMIYVFDSDQELGACCGCRVSSNGLATLSTANDLVSNWLVRVTSAVTVPNKGVVVIVPSTPNSGTSGGANKNGCDPTAAYTELPSLNAWMTHVEGYERADGTSLGGLSVTPFTQDSTDTTENAYLISECAFVQGDGSSAGICAKANTTCDN